MYEILILGGISGSIYFYFRNKLLNEKKISEQETITLRAMRDEKIREIEELKKKLPKQLTDEDKEAMKIWGVKYEKFICNFYKEKGYIVEHIGVKNDELTDEKIDIIAKKDNKISLIECKYWTNKTIEYKDINEIFGKYNFFINENHLSKENIDFKIVFPKINNLTKTAKTLLLENKNICKYEIIPFIKNEFKLILGIIESENKCYICQKNTTVIALKFYNSYDFIEIEDKIVYYLFEKLPEDMLNLIRKKYPKYNYKVRKSDNFYYVANNCMHCEAIQDDKHLYDKKDGVFYNVDDLEPKYYIAYNEKTETLEYISEFYN
ncbi:restriction endonuclease [Aliarcobacter cryaerophilus]|uniref:restriction endonuclease n=1 Tax=Aliarcobacter cryaerophilus TaxID=28198 RepID=UPI0008268FE8|nr:restriction endonuclease [Aliarcobacter cryaerophilus]